MDTGPASGLTAMISVPDAAASNAAARIFCVIVSVVLGLMTLIFINASSPNSRPRSAQCRRRISKARGYLPIAFQSASLRQPVAQFIEPIELADDQGLHRNTLSLLRWRWTSLIQGMIISDFRRGDKFGLDGLGSKRH